MSILWRSKAIIINRLIYRRTMTTGLVARNNIDGSELKPPWLWRSKAIIILQLPGTIFLPMYRYNVIEELWSLWTGAPYMVRQQNPQRNLYTWQWSLNTARATCHRRAKTLTPTEYPGWCVPDYAIKQTPHRTPFRRLTLFVPHFPIHRSPSP
jgi:hypothetical protein